MKPRHAKRLAAKVWAKAARCKVAPTEWVAMSRAERKRRLAEACRQEKRR